MPSASLTPKGGQLGSGGAVRRSMRETKRPKFDDELVQSIPLASIRKKNISGRTSPELASILAHDLEEPAHRTRKRVARHSGGSQQISPVVSAKAAARSANLTDKAESGKVIKAETKLTENITPPINILSAERKRKEKLACKYQGFKLEGGGGYASSSSTSYVNMDNMKRWTAEDDISLVAAVTHVKLFYSRL